MDLLERYLQAVKACLPRHEQDDILRELSESIRSQMEDREAELGRPLTEDEQADILRRHGRPIVVAGRYRPQQHLIGPAFFPFYLSGLKVGLAIVLITILVPAILSPALSDNVPARILELALSVPGRLLTMFAVVTLMFTAMDVWQSKMRLPDAWDPRHLPPVVRFERRRSRRGVWSRLAFTVCWLVFLLFVPGRPYLLLGPEAPRVLGFAPILSTMYLPVLVLIASAIVIDAMSLVRPLSTTTYSTVRIVYLSAVLTVAGLMLWSDGLFTGNIDEVLRNGRSVEETVRTLNVMGDIGLIVACLVCTGGIVVDIRCLRARSPRSATTVEVS
jgi:hypothetical protein